MLIYLQTLTYEGQPLLWEYSPTENVAKCIYQVVGNGTKVDPEVVNETLKKINGIKISDGIALLVDCPSFEKETSVYVEHSKPVPRGALLSPSFFTAVAPAQNSNSVAKLLSFDSLLAGFEGSTLCYESILRDNNNTNLEKLTALKIHSSASVHLTVQVVKNVDFYILRQIQIKLIRALYEDFFISSLSDFKPEAPPKAIDYFRKAITSIMENTKYNAQDTAFELAFKEDKEPVPIEDNYKIRVIYARHMLAAFLYFVEDIAPPLKSDGKETEESNKLKEWLPIFKKHMQVHKEKIAHLLNDLEQLIICTGLMQHDHSPFTVDSLTFVNGNLDFSLLRTKLKVLQMDVEHSTLAVALKKLNPTHTIPTDLVPVPQKIYSLKSFVYECFEQSLHEKIRTEFKEDEINAHVENIMKQLIVEMRNYTNGSSHAEAAQWVSHTISIYDGDLYITREWQILLEEKFKKSKEELGITRSKHTSQLETGIVKLVSSFVHQQVEELKPKNQTLSSNTMN
jgi:hypothetical protein